MGGETEGGAEGRRGVRREWAKLWDGNDSAQPRASEDTTRPRPRRNRAGNTDSTGK